MKKSHRQKYIILKKRIWGFGTTNPWLVCCTGVSVPFAWKQRSSSQYAVLFSVAEVKAYIAKFDEQDMHRYAYKSEKYVA